MKPTIRKANLSDLPFLVRLEQQAFPEFQQTHRQNIKQGLFSAFQEILLVEDSKKEQHPLGAFTLFKYKHTLRIYSIALLPEFRNKGLGTFILQYVKKFAVKHHFSLISLEVHSTNETLIRWYENFGFKKLHEIKEYYTEGEHAYKMQLVLDEYSKNSGYRNIIVIDQPFKWERTEIKAKVISVKEYITHTLYQNNTNFRVFNLCSSYKYQRYGYYISLLASARGQRVIPTIATITDVKNINVIQSVAFELNALINHELSKESTTTFSLDIFFGQTPYKAYKTLAAKLYQLFEAPLFRVTLIKHEKWLIKNVKILSFSSLTLDQKETVYDLAAHFFHKKRYNYPTLTNYLYDLAILVNPNEKNPPSNKEALEKITAAGNKRGIYVEFITKDDKDKINEFDALFIRETTNVNHYTYEFSRLAFSEGLVVIDDPWSILRCSNKIYQHELFTRNKIPTPHTIALTKNSFSQAMLKELSYPLVLKQPDSAFSLGVTKVASIEEAEVQLKHLFELSDMVVCQQFLYSEYDWRIGVLNNQPLFACKYFMTKNHWQIYDWNSSEDEQSGSFETISISDVPSDVLSMALKAVSLIGDGLYGVDLKYVNGKVYLIEVNDNPNIDAGVEDAVLKDELYHTLIDSIIQRIEIAKNIRKIDLR